MKRLYFSRNPARHLGYQPSQGKQVRTIPAEIRNCNNNGADIDREQNRGIIPNILLFPEYSKFASIQLH